MKASAIRRALLALLLLTSGSAGWAVSARAAAPDDPVRARYATDFGDALRGYERLAQMAEAHTGQGLVPLDARWESEMKAVDAHLVPHERTFFPLMYRPWTREAAVFSNLEGARMWLWSVRDALSDGARGVESLDVAGGRVRAELMSNAKAYLAKARALLAGGHFTGSYFDDTLTPLLADYCTYPEDGGRVRPDFNDPTLFQDAAEAARARATTGPAAAKPAGGKAL